MAAALLMDHRRWEATLLATLRAHGGSDARMMADRKTPRPYGPRVKREGDLGGRSWAKKGFDALGCKNKRFINVRFLTAKLSLDT